MSLFSKTYEQPFNLLDEQAYRTNQMGEITAIQQQALKTAIRWSRIIGSAVLIVVLVGLFGLTAIPALLQENVSLYSLISALCLGLLFLPFALLMAYSLSVHLMNIFKLMQDINNRSIQRGQGQIVYGKNGYSFESNGNKLKLAGNLSNGLLPGVTYQVCYLERSKMLISAANAFQATPMLAQDAINNILASANGFSTDDVLNNQNGQATFAQLSKLIPNIIFGIVVILICLAFMGGIILNAISSNSRTPIWGLFLAIGIIGLISLIVSVSSGKSLLDLLSPKLRQVQGQGYKDQRIVGSGKNRRVEYSYIIAGQRFVVKYQPYTALIDGLQYRAYYLERSGMLISIEAVNVDKR